MRTDIGDLREILKAFREETREISDQATTDLLELEQKADDPPKPLVERLFRNVHTIKGNAASLGIDDVSKLAHVGETLLGEVDKGKRPFHAGLTDALLSALDEIGKRLDGLLAGQLEAGAGLRAAQVRLERILAGEEASPVPSESLAAPPAAGAHRDPLFRVAAERVEAFSFAVDELVLARTRATQRASDATRLSLTLDALVRRVRSGFGQEQAAELRRLGRDLAGLARDLKLDTQYMSTLSDDLRDELRSLQVTPASTILEPFRRAVRDHARSREVEVAFEVVGGEISADRRVLEGLRTALVHILRNAVDHGVEPSTDRVAAGKPARAVIRVAVEVVGSRLQVAISDDGRGIDAERVRRIAVERGVITDKEAARLTERGAIGLIWRPGFSTAKSVSETSGRGVGLDAVRDTIAQLSGRIDLETRVGQGTTFVVQVPLMRRDAVGMLVEAAGSPYLVPLSAIEAIQRVDLGRVEKVNGVPVIDHLGRAIQVVPLQAALVGRASAPPVGEERPLACVVSGANETVALLVDRVEGEREMSVRPLGPELRRFDHLAGVTLIGDGRTVLVLGMMGLVSRALEASRVHTAEATQPRTVLVVDDAVTSRLLYRTFLEAAGYRVLLAGDGQEALEMLGLHAVDAVLADVRMPLMDGRELTRRIRNALGLPELPVLLVSSLGSEDERREGLRAGANAYIVKSETSPSEILEVLQGLVS